MSVAPGTRLGPYEIVSRIGAGGMGEVWRARDTRLDRSVAVKLLSSELANNAQLKIRFEREARSISQLNHPHICTLFDVGDDRGTSYLVMELLEGETLADRLTKGAMPLADVIRYGIQISDALDRAHHAGIVHRDLKPGNIMITKSGAKLLDFGLAKTSTTPVAGDAPTMQKDLTQEGTILGTFQYMAPEQLEGADADTRTDIFALGALLYEMTTGKRAFEGKTRTSLIAAIVAGQPAPIRTMQPLAPSALDHVIATCLEKDPDKRWQSARDVANELTWISEGASVEQLAITPNRWWPIAAAVLAVIAVVTSIMIVRERTTPATPIAFSMLPPRGEVFVGAPVIAPNGRVIAFVGREDSGVRSIWVRRIGDVDPIRLATNINRASNPFWSPDSKSIAYFATDALMRISVDGGQPELIAKVDGYGVDGAWSNSGDIVFTPKFGAGLYRVAASGGEPIAITTLDVRRHENVHAHVRFLSDGDHFLYVVHALPDSQNQICAGSLRANFQKPVAKVDALVGIWNGWILTVRNAALYAQRFDEKTFAVSGEPRKIVDDVRYSEESASARANIADDGAIVYQTASTVASRVELAWYDDAGRFLQKISEENGAGALSLSPDDSKIAMLLPDVRKGATDVYVREIGRGVLTRVTSGLSNHQDCVWSPDGSRVYFSSDRAGMYDIYSQSDDGVSAPQVVWKGGDDKHPASISPDGKTLLATLYSRKTKEDLWIVPLDGGAPRPWIVTDGAETTMSFSPDGQWITYVSDHSGQLETYVAAFPDGRSYQVSTSGGGGAEWSHDGSRVIFADGINVYAADVKRSGKVATVGKPVVLFTKPKTMNGWWRSKTADRFLWRTVVDPRESVQYANYIKGWDAALK